MRTLPVLVLSLLLVAPLGAHAMTVRNSNLVPGGANGVWQMSCTVVFESDGAQNCKPFLGTIRGATDVQVRIQGAASIFAYGDLKQPGGGVRQIFTVNCARSCVVEFPASSGELDVYTAIQGATGAVVRISVGTDLSGVLL